MNLQKHYAAVNKMAEIDEKKALLSNLTHQHKREMSGDRNEYILGIKPSKDLVTEIFKLMESKLLEEIKQLEHEFKMI